MQFEIPELLEMARGIASGMKYLSELGFIHRVSFFTVFYLSCVINRHLLKFFSTAFLCLTI